MPLSGHTLVIYNSDQVEGVPFFVLPKSPTHRVCVSAFFSRLWLLKSKNNVLFIFSSQLLRKIQLAHEKHSKKICSLNKLHQSWPKQGITQMKLNHWHKLVCDSFFTSYKPLGGHTSKKIPTLSVLHKHRNEKCFANNQLINYLKRWIINTHWGYLPLSSKYSPWLSSSKL